MREIQNGTRTKDDSPGSSQEDLQKEPVSKVTTNTCYRCAKADHFAWQCLFKNAKCYNCGKIGHTKKACQGRQATGGRLTETGRQSKQQTRKLPGERTQLKQYKLKNS